MKKQFILLAALTHASCAPPKGIVMEEAPNQPKPQEIIVPSPPAVPDAPVLVDDGLRLPDMLTLPDENQLRSAAPLKKPSDATIIASPPTE